MYILRKESGFLQAEMRLPSNRRGVLYDALISITLDNDFCMETDAPFNVAWD